MPQLRNAMNLAPAAPRLVATTKPLKARYSSPPAKLPKRLQFPSSTMLTLRATRVSPSNWLIPAAADPQPWFLRAPALTRFSQSPVRPPGFGFWTNKIDLCGTNQQCIEVKRINVSAVFFLSIEFQTTGYLVGRLYKSSYGDAVGMSTIGGTHPLSVPIVRFNEFLPDTQAIGQEIGR